ncbi:hypothetical protein C2W62_27580 [Candidatus Entotheonella serta]|nr:hypothetical protein C2W62_27580 [Candidatus Entotheonella serta]
MQTKLVPWLLIWGLLFGVMGCDSSSDNPTDPLTVTNLQGTYDLDVSTSMLGNTLDAGVDLVSGTLDVDTVMAVLALMVTQTQTFVVTNATTLTATDDEGDMTDVQATLTNNGATLTLISSGDTLVLNKRGGSSTGTDLTIDNLQGTYDLDVAASSPLDIGDADFVVTSAVLDVMDDNITFTATGTNAVTYTGIVNYLAEKWSSWDEGCH